MSAARVSARLTHRVHVDDYVLADDGVRIPLCDRAGGVIAYATIDAADVELVWDYRWHRDSSGYAVRSQRGGPRRSVRMHRQIAGVIGKDAEIDHINRDRLDNRRANLRICTRAENSQNHPGLGGYSRYRGVSFNKRRGKWIAQVRYQGKNRHLGYFASERAAAVAADEFRQQHLPFALPEDLG